MRVLTNLWLRQEHPETDEVTENVAKQVQSIATENTKENRHFYNQLWLTV